MLYTGHTIEVCILVYRFTVSSLIQNAHLCMLYVRTAYTDVCVCMPYIGRAVLLCTPWRGVPYIRRTQGDIWDSGRWRRSPTTPCNDWSVHVALCNEETNLHNTIVPAFVDTYVHILHCTASIVLLTCVYVIHGRMLHVGHNHCMHTHS